MMSNSFLRKEIDANFPEGISFYNLENGNKDVEVKCDYEDGMKSNERYYNQEELGKSANEFSEVNVKYESEVKKEQIRIQHSEIEFKQDIEIKDEPITFTVESAFVKDKNSFKSHLGKQTCKKTYQCIQCDKFFSHKVFIEHQKTHKREKLHQCSQCDK
ncbi:unnamed protein product, partial [Meganyctiphanes norvegica]